MHKVEHNLANFFISPVDDHIVATRRNRHIDQMLSKFVFQLTVEHSLATCNNSQSSQFFLLQFRIISLSLFATRHSH